MADEILKKDGNNTPVSGGVDDATDDILKLRIDPTSKGALVHPVGAGGGDTWKTDDSAFTAGTDSVAPVGLLADSTSTDSVDEGDIGAARMTLDRRTIVTNEHASSANGVASIFRNFGANATLNVKSSAGNVFSATCHNENANTRYFQLHNTATVPGASDVPEETFAIGSGEQAIIGTDYFTTNGARFDTGIAFAFSTTKDTYTAGTAADQTTLIRYS